MRIEFIPKNFQERQLALHDFNKAVKPIVRQDVHRTFNHELVVLMLLELAKNTFDHSSGIGILDMQLPTGCNPLLVTYIDTGHYFDWVACAEIGQSDKSGNGINFGLGLAFVRQGSAVAGIELTVERVENATEFRFKGRNNSLTP